MNQTQSEILALQEASFERPDDRSLVVAAQGFPALSKCDRKGNYIVTPLLADTTPAYLERDVDFGVIPKTKKPSLYKSGAEKIIAAYRFMPRYTINSSIEQHTKDGDFFFYNITCSLWKGFINPESNQFIQVEYANGMGSANTGESSNGFNSGANAANNVLKKAQKRAMVQAVLAISGLSSMFTQDMEDETAIQSKDIIDQKPTDIINSKQAQRLFAVAGQNGLDKEQFKEWLKAEGYPGTKSITVEQFDKIIDQLKKIND